MQGRVVFAGRKTHWICPTEMAMPGYINLSQRLTLPHGTGEGQIRSKLAWAIVPFRPPPTVWGSSFLHPGKGGDTSLAAGLVGTLTALAGWCSPTTHKLETKKACKGKLLEHSNTAKNRSCH